MGNVQLNASARLHLTEREISYIVLHTNFTRKQIDEFQHRFLTHFPLGYLTLEQFDQLYAGELKHLTDVRPFLEKLFQQIDTDRNGKLTFKELVFFKGISRAETSCEEKLRWIFFLYDTNEDRKIDENEYLDLFRLIYHVHGLVFGATHEEQIKELFQRYDRDDDRLLSWKEFRHLCEQRRDLLELMSPMFRQTQWKFSVKRRKSLKNSTFCLS